MSLMVAHQTRIQYHEDLVTPSIPSIHSGHEQCIRVKQGYETSHLDKDNITHLILVWCKPYS